MEPLPSDDLYKERYTVEKKIGQGGFGKVFLVKEKDGEKCYAAKCIKVREVIENATKKIVALWLLFKTKLIKDEILQRQLQP